MIYNKKGISVWVSAVLYFGLGIVILTLILSAGMPVINRMRDKNVAIQTKDIFHGLDKMIREVAKEGPGSQRVLTLEMKKGSLNIDHDEDEISWNFSTTAILSEPTEPDKEPNIIREGNIDIWTTTTLVEDEYELHYMLNYSCVINLDITPKEGLSIITGTTDLVISNGGPTIDVPSECDVPSLITIKIIEKTTA